MVDPWQYGEGRAIVSGHVQKVLLYKESYQGALAYLAAYPALSYGVRDSAKLLATLLHLSPHKMAYQAPAKAHTHVATRILAKADTSAINATHQTSAARGVGLSNVNPTANSYVRNLACKSLMAAGGTVQTALQQSLMALAHAQSDTAYQAVALNVQRQPAQVTVPGRSRDRLTQGRPSLQPHPHLTTAVFPMHRWTLHLKVKPLYLLQASHVLHRSSSSGSTTLPRAMLWSNWHQLATE